MDLFDFLFYDFMYIQKLLNKRMHYFYNRKNPISDGKKMDVGCAYSSASISLVIHTTERDQS